MAFRYIGNSPPQATVSFTSLTATTITTSTAVAGTETNATATGNLKLSSAASATDIVPYVTMADARILLGAPQLAFA